jgi:hypothetical protein
MRFRVLIEGEHAEGLDSRERFRALVGAFLDSMKANGFLGEVSEFTVDYRPPKTIFERVYPELSTSAEVVIPEWQPDEVLEVMEAEALGEVAFAEVRPLSEIAADFAPLPPAEEVFAEPMSDAALRAAIRRLKKEIGGNKILSQTEMAERLGVTRYRIHKVLK